MTILLTVVSKQVVIWANCIHDPVVYLLICDVLCIRYVEESSVSSHLHCLYSALMVGGECPGFACITGERIKWIFDEIYSQTWYMCCAYLSHNTLRLNICSPVLLPALNHVCSSVSIASACGFSLFRMTFSITLLGWLVLTQLHIYYSW